MTDRIPEPVIIYEVPSVSQILDEAIVEFCREVYPGLDDATCRRMIRVKKYGNGWRVVRVVIGPREYTLCATKIDPFEKTAIIRKITGGSYPATFICKLIDVLGRYGITWVLDLGQEE